MKIISLAALPLSLILGVMPFALIAVDDIAAAKTDVQVNLGADQAAHASGREGR